MERSLLSPGTRNVPMNCGKVIATHRTVLRSRILPSSNQRHAASLIFPAVTAKVTMTLSSKSLDVSMDRSTRRDHSSIRSSLTDCGSLSYWMQSSRAIAHDDGSMCRLYLSENKREFNRYIFRTESSPFRYESRNPLWGIMPRLVSSKIPEVAQIPDHRGRYPACFGAEFCR